MQSIRFDDANFDEKLAEEFTKWGVAVVTGVFPEAFCDEKVDEIVSGFEYLNTGINRKKLAETWTFENLPPQTRPGLFQTSLGHSQPVWDIRSHRNVRKIFESIYSHLRGHEVTDFITSYDGINVIPNEVGPFHGPKTKDWPHIDQTIRGDMWKCVQGQAVLTNTTAAFRATPGSCHMYEKVLDLEEVDEKDKSNWCMFRDPKKVQDMFEEIGLEWQKPILSPKGSFIIWSSSTVHSAKYPDKKEKPEPTDLWKGWRCVVYVCYRPREELSAQATSKRLKNLKENRLTNHWGEKMFGKTPGGRYLYMKPRHPTIEAILSEPKHVYSIIGEPEIDESLL